MLLDILLRECPGGHGLDPFIMRICPIHKEIPNAEPTTMSTVTILCSSVEATESYSSGRLFSPHLAVKKAPEILPFLGLLNYEHCKLKLFWWR